MRPTAQPRAALAVVEQQLQFEESRASRLFRDLAGRQGSPTRRSRLFYPRFLFPCGCASWRRISKGVVFGTTRKHSHYQKCSKPTLVRQRLVLKSMPMGGVGAINSHLTTIYIGVFLSVDRNWRASRYKPAGFPRLRLAQCGNVARPYAQVVSKWRA